MKIYYILFFLFGALLFSTAASTQNVQTSTIKWNCTSTFTANPGSIDNEMTKVVSSSDQIVWYDSNDVVRKTFAITGSDGTWSNVSNNGSITFNITAGNDVEIVQFFRTAGVAKVRIIITEDNTPQSYELTVTTVNEL